MPKTWSHHVTDMSDALTLEDEVFTKKNGREMARSLKRSASAKRELRRL